MAARRGMARRDADVDGGPGMERARGPQAGGDRWRRLHLHAMPGAGGFDVIVEVIERERNDVIQNQEI